MLHCVLGGYYYFETEAVIYSNTATHFECDNVVSDLTGKWYGGYYAPVVFEWDTKWYFAGYSEGLWVAEFEWVEKTPAEIKHWQDTTWAQIKKEYKQHSHRDWCHS